MKYLCTLEVETNCELLIGKDTCKGNPACAFCAVDKPDDKQQGYVRKERWYEKYYKDKW